MNGLIQFFEGIWVIHPRRAMRILRFSESIGKWEHTKDSQISNTTNMIPQCLDFTSLAVPDVNFPTIIEAGLDDFVNLTSSRFFQASPTRSEVILAVAVEMGGLLLRLWRLRVLILSYLPLFRVNSCTKVVLLTHCLAICKCEQQRAAEWSQFRVRKWEMPPDSHISFVGKVLFMAETALIVHKSMPFHKCMPFGSDCRTWSSSSAERFSGFGVWRPSCSRPAGGATRSPLGHLSRGFPVVPVGSRRGSD
jgi:hypothetical protein